MTGALRLVVAVIALAGVAAGCSAGTAGGGGAAPSPAAAQVAGATGPTLSACAKAGLAVAIPSDFPASFPLPDGSVVVETDTSAGGGTRIKALVPLEVRAFGEYLERALPAAGLAIGGGEAEANELESKFSGAGVAGQLTARELSGCPGVLSVQVAIRAS